jgi:rubrerythrin
MKIEQVKELLLQSLEHESGGIEIYETALQCAVHEDLREEFAKYLEETREHERILRETCEALSLDPEEETPGRQVIRHMGASLVEAMKKAKAAGNPEAAQLVAAECVTLAETKCQLDWELIGKCAENFSDEAGTVLKEAHEQVQEQENEHLYHTKGWCRELWIHSLGMKAMLPPLEEERDVHTPVEAAKAEQQSIEGRR